LEREARWKPRSFTECGGLTPLFCHRKQADKRMSQIEKVILKFIPRYDGITCIRQSHLPPDLISA